MRTLPVGLALVVALSTAAYGQSMEERYQAKLKKPFLKNAAWVHDFAEAKRKAKELQKPIFAYFTRSYAP
jgi:hypothetical protein